MKTHHLYRSTPLLTVRAKATFHSFAVAMLLIIGFSACQPNNVSPTQNQEGQQARLAALPSPTVTTLNSMAPCYNWPPNAPATNISIPWIGQKNVLVIKGTNFGTTPGKVVATAFSGQALTTFGFAVASWKDAEIQLQVGAAPSASPLAITIGITTADNRSISTSFTAVPMISGRIYGTPAFYTNQNRILMNMWPSPYTASTVNSGSLGDTYTPQKGDIWYFPNGQESVIVSVNSYSRLISQSKVSKVERVTYNVTNAEWANGTGSSIGRGIEYEVSTTYFSNAPSRVSTKLITPVASAFSSVVRSSSPARTYYR